MRNLDGKLMWVIKRPLLAVMLLLMLSAPICQAQCFGLVYSWYGTIPGATITPDVWAPGQSYVVTIMSPTDQWFTYDSSYGSWDEYEGYVVTYGDYWTVMGGSGNFTEDPYVTLDSVVYVTYDSSSRLTLVSYPDGSAFNFTYDPTYSMLLSVTDVQGNLIEAHTYDSQQRGLTSTRANGVDSVTLSY